MPLQLACVRSLRSLTRWCATVHCGTLKVLKPPDEKNVGRATKRLTTNTVALPEGEGPRVRVFVLRSRSFKEFCNSFSHLPLVGSYPGRARFKPASTNALSNHPLKSGTPVRQTPRKTIDRSHRNCYSFQYDYMLRAHSIYSELVGLNKPAFVAPSMHIGLLNDHKCCMLSYEASA